MTKLTEKDFAIFDLEQFSFKQIKQQMSEEEVIILKERYQSVWQKWKTIQLNVYQELDTEVFGKPKIESWTNGWNLRNHFWSAYRGTNQQNHNACLGVLLNKKQLQVYLMFQNYKSLERAGTKEAYNELLNVLPTWSRSIDSKCYRIWPQQEHELCTHKLLNDYLSNPKQQTDFKQEISNQTFQLGTFYFREAEIANVEQKILKSLQELVPLYQIITHDKGE